MNKLCQFVNFIPSFFKTMILGPREKRTTTYFEVAINRTVREIMEALESAAYYKRKHFIPNIILEPLTSPFWQYK